MNFAAESREAEARRICDRLEFALALEFSPETTLDLLWLLAQWSESSEFFRVQDEQSGPDPPKDKTGSAPSSTHAPNASEPTEQDAQESPSLNEDVDEVDEELGSSDDEIPIYAPSTPSSQRPSRGLPVDLPSPPPFPNLRGFLNAWRPLWYRGASRVAFQIDIDATVRRWVTQGILDPVSLSVPERQVEAVVVVDAAPSMDPWRSSGHEVARALAACGGFRRVSALALIDSEKEPRLVALHRIADPEAPNATLPRLGGSPHVTFLLTDLISELWNDRRWIERLDEWAQYGTLAFLQPLPQRLWNRTALADALDRRLLSQQARTGNATAISVTEPAGNSAHDYADREIEPPEFGNAYYPVAPLHDFAGVRRLAKFLADRRADAYRCYRLRIVDQIPNVATLTPEDAFEEFRLNGSRRARNLATLLAAAPAIMLPIARILQRAFLGGAADPAVESEVWNAGLLEAIEEQPGVNPDEAIYDFRAGLRDRFLDGAPADLRTQIFRRTAEFIEQELGRLHGLSAWIDDPENHRGALDARTGADPIAVISAQILRRQGGPLSDLVRSTRSRAAPIDMAPLASHEIYAEEGMPHRFAWSPDGSKLAVPSLEGKLSVIHIGSGEDVSVQAGSMGLNAAAWSPDGSRIAVACFTHVVRLFTEGLREVATLHGHNSDITAVAFSPKGNWLATGTAGGTVRIWDVEERTLLEYRSFGTTIRNVLWIGDDSLVTVDGLAAYFLRFDPIKRTCAVRRFSVPANAVATLRPQKRMKWYRSAKTVVAFGLANGSIQMWDPAIESKLAEFFPHRASLRSIDFSSDGRLLASKAKDGSVAVIRLSDGRVVALHQAGEVSFPYSTAAFRPGTKFLAVSEDDRRRIRLFDLSQVAAARKPKRRRVLICGEKFERARSESSSGDGGFADRCRALGEEIGRRGHDLAIASGLPYSFCAYVLQGYLRSASHDAEATAFGSEFGTLEAMLENSAAKVDARRFASEAVTSAFGRHAAEAALRKALLEQAPDFPTVQSQFATVGDFLGNADQAHALDRVLGTLADSLPGNGRLSLAVKIAREANRDNRLDPRIRQERIEGEKTWTTTTWVRALRGVDAVIAAEEVADDEEKVQRLAEGYGIPFRRLDSQRSLDTEISELEREAAAAAESRNRSLEGLYRVSGRQGNEIYSSTGLALHSHYLMTIRGWAPRESSTTRNQSQQPQRAHEGNADVSQWPETLIVESADEESSHPVNLVRQIATSGIPDVRLLLLRTPEAMPTIQPDLLTSGTAAERRIHAERLIASHAAEFLFLRVPKDSELLDAPVLIHGVEESSRGAGHAARGIVTRFDEESISLSVDGLPGIGALGSLVTTRLQDRPCLVGVVVGAHRDGKGEFVRAARLTTEIVSAIREAVERSVRERPLSIWLVGSGTHDLPDAVLQASRLVGELLGRSGDQLVTGGWPGVDYVTAEAFLSTQTGPGGTAPRGQLLHVMPRGAKPDFPHGEVIHVDRDEDYFRLEAVPCDAVIVIGGLGGARLLAETAMERSIPVFSLRGTGGDADEMHERLIARWAKSPLPRTSVEEFVDATDWRRGPQAERLGRLLRKAAGRDDDRLPAS